MTARTRSMASSIATGPMLQLTPITSAPQSLSLAAKVSGIGSVEAVGILIDGDGSDDRELRIHVARSEHGLMQLFDVAEGLQNQQIHAAFGQRRNLFPKGCARLFERCFAERLNSNSQRANRTRNPYIEALGGFARQACARRG